MRVSQPFLRLPISFCAETLEREMRQLPASAWTPHPQGYPGNDAVVLISPGGALTDDIAGEMAPTTHLRASPYIMALMGELGGVWGRSRMMGLGAGAEVPLHVDVHYYWRTHLRIHIPIVTNPDVKFTCGDETVHMAPGECWVFDSFRPHRVHNGGSDKRVHLVLDTIGGERLWSFLRAAEKGESAPSQPWQPQPGDEARPLAFEQVNVPKVMSPWEIRCHVDYMLEHAIPAPELAPLLEQVDWFLAAWHAAWGRYGTSDEGLPTYRSLVTRARAKFEAAGAQRVMLRNTQTFAYTMEALVFWNAIAREPEKLSAVTERTKPSEHAAAAPVAQAESTYREKIERPLFIVSTPRSGSTLLFETFSQAPDLYSPGGESHGLIEGIPAFAVPARAWSSNRLTAADATPGNAEQLARAFYQSLSDRDGNPAAGAVRMLEKTPKNALRVPLFDAIWPDSEFIFLYRDPRQTLSSMLEAWLSGGFRTYPGLPGWQGYPWSLLLVPGWANLIGRPLPEIVARQWATTVDILLDDLLRLPRERVRVVDYDELVKSPQPVVEELAASLGLEWDRELGGELPLSKTTVSRPDREKWRQIEHVIEAIWPIVSESDAKARRFLDSIRNGDRQEPEVLSAASAR